MKEYHIAVIPGDGIGKEVTPEGVRVLDAVAQASGAFRHVHAQSDGFARCPKVPA